MTQNEAQERALKIWGPAATISFLGRHWGLRTEWLVEVKGDYWDHGLDPQGHITCDHRECLEKERSL